MRVGFDAAIYAYPPGGIATYQTALMRALAGVADIETVFAGGYALSQTAGQPPGLKRPLIRHRRVLLGLNLMQAWGLASDIHHLTAFWKPPRLRAGRTVLTLYDMIPERLGEFYPALRGVHFQKAKLASEADAVICISETVRRDALDLLGLPPERVTAIPLGAPVIHPPGIGGVDRFADRARRYVLIVGRRSLYKNFIDIVPALGAAMAGERDVSLVCVGGGAFTPFEMDALRIAGLGGRAEQMALNDPDLSDAYRNALVVIAPSRAEGFGLPVLEAMAHGAPVLASNIPAHREVAGDAVAWFDPQRPESLAPVLKPMLEGPARLDALRAMGRERAKLFTWEKCAAATAAIYRQVAAR